MWPQGVLSRISWIIVSGVIALLLALHAYHVHERLLTSATAFATSVAERLLAIDNLLTQHDVPRQRLFDAFSGRDVDLQLAAAWPATDDREWPHAEEVRDAVRRNLAHESHREFRIQFAIDRTQRHRRPQLIMGLERADGTWLVARASSAALEASWASLALSWNLFLVVVILVVMLWLARRALKQLPRFVAAAEQLGRNNYAETLREDTGPKEVRRLAAAFNDSQRRIREHLEERTAMLAAISHDLRTFLTRLALRMEFIADDEQHDRARRDIAEMSQLLDSVTAFAREDRAEEAVVKVDVSSLLQSLIGDAVDLGHAATFEGSPGVTIHGRKLALKRAFGNLIDNAIRYGSCADVRLTRGAAGGVIVTIADRGPGIPIEERSRLLKPFTRLEESRNRETGGSGLGLAIVDTVIRRHGGHLAFLEREGGGLMVRVELP